MCFTLSVQEMLSVITIATGAIISPYVKQGVVYISQTSHGILSANVPGYEDVSRQTEWICSNPKCKSALVDQTPLASMVSVIVGNVLGANCKDCTSPLQYSHNVSPVTKYECLAGLCDIDLAGEFAEKIMNEYDRRARRDASKQFTQVEWNSISYARLTIESYLRRNIKSLRACGASLAP